MNELLRRYSTLILIAAFLIGIALAFFVFNLSAIYAIASGIVSLIVVGFVISVIVPLINQ
jgi:hypothetical protein